MNTHRISDPFLLVLICLLLPAVSAYGHGKKHHHVKENLKEGPGTDVSKHIQEEYLLTVKPIFEAKCFNCHSALTVFPWYHDLPGVGRIIDSHVKEGLSHIDMTYGFPFKGHGGPVKDIEAIIKTTEADTMPPRYYSIFHQDSRLTEAEKRVILDWSKNSLSKMKVKKK